ncbi:hypothetical protein [Thermococcus paralvinellae]|nr:hypothetical protein [Thermococcus paralvinellae]
MISQTHLKVLRKLYERLKDSDVNWVVTGRNALYKLKVWKFQFWI